MIAPPVVPLLAAVVYVDPMLVIPLAGMAVGAIFIVTVGTIIREAIGKSKAPDSRLLAGVERRLERIEQAIDTMAVEVERISEGQRFTTKLLSERSPAAPDRPAP
jgi:hypothetical protein